MDVYGINTARTEMHTDVSDKSGDHHHHHRLQTALSNSTFRA